MIPKMIPKRKWPKRKYFRRDAGPTYAFFVRRHSDSWENSVSFIRGRWTRSKEHNFHFFFEINVGVRLFSRTFAAIIYRAETCARVCSPQSRCSCSVRVKWSRIRVTLAGKRMPNYFSSLARTRCSNCARSEQWSISRSRLAIVAARAVGGWKERIRGLGLSVSRLVRNVGAADVTDILSGPAWLF